MQIYNLLTLGPLFGLEMGDEGTDVVAVFSGDVVFDFPKFFDDFVRHVQIVIVAGVDGLSLPALVLVFGQAFLTVFDN